MSERDKVGEVKKVLQQKCRFCEKIWIEPNLVNISNPAISNIFRTNKVTPDLFYFNKSTKLLFLLEAKSEIANHQEAIKDIKDALESHPGDLPNAIFIDINMPSMNGWEFLEALETIANPLIIYYIIIFCYSSLSYNINILFWF